MLWQKGGLMDLCNAFYQAKQYIAVYAQIPLCPATNKLWAKPILWHSDTYKKQNILAEVSLHKLHWLTLVDAFYTCINSLPNDKI